MDILFPHFISLAEQRPQFIRFLPFAFAVNSPQKSEVGLPIFEPAKRKVFDRLLEKYIGVFFRRIAWESRLSEYSARTVAMEHSAAKTEKLIETIRHGYAKARQRAVTQKQLESFTVHKTL